MSVVIYQATLEHLDAVTSLFDGYRVFYEQESNLHAARAFIEARLRAGDSVILLATDDCEALGFAQLYPSYSSVSMKRLWILNDLYVAKSGRRKGVGKALMERARQHALDTGAKGLVLETAVDNHGAQKLYELCGWEREEAFYRYELMF